MRGDKTQQVAILSAVTTEQLVPPDHPTPALKPAVERALQAISLAGGLGVAEERAAARRRR